MDTFQKLKQMAVSGGLREADYLEIEDDIQSSNRIIVTIFSAVSAFMLAVLFCVSSIVEPLAANRSLYGTGFCIVLILFLSAWFNKKGNRVQMLVTVYLFSILLLTIGIVLGTVLGPHEISATYIAFLLAVPQLFTDRPYRMYILIICSMVVFICVAHRIKDPSTWTSDITNTIVFGILSMLLATYSVDMRLSRMHMEKDIEFLASHDKLTGLRNRLSFEAALDAADAPGMGAAYCVYIDANGLHELNNTKGHEAGDAMLQCVAGAMQKQFGEAYSYRIGGDEFVAFGSDFDADAVNDCVMAIKQEVEAAGYHLAAGVSFRENGDLSAAAVLKEAEQAMFRDKSAYYQSTGIDRRRR